MDEFEAITADLRAESRCEQVEQAREILAAADATARFRDVLGRIPTGEVVLVATADGWLVRGRIVRVGDDWVRIAEVRDGSGTARVTAARLHELPLAAVIRVSRESGR